MEIEKYSPKWLLEKLNTSKTDTHKLMHIIQYRKEIVESTEKQLNLSGVSQQRELLLAYHKHLDSFNDTSIYNATENMINDYLANNCG